jgi:hypothetical protein
MLAPEGPAIQLITAMSLPQIMNSSRIRDYNPQGLVFTNCLDSPDFMRWAGKVFEIYLMKSYSVSSEVV